MAEEPIDLIRLEGDGNSVVLRISGRGGQPGHGGTGALSGEFVVDTPFVRGSLATSLLPEDLSRWQQALDGLDTGQNIAWREGQRAPWLLVELDDAADRCHVTVKDPSRSLTAVTVTVPLPDAWFDDAYQRLDRVWETWPPA
ncbi:DUF5959 family protein, partial [Actinacidiphila rubida]